MPGRGPRAGILRAVIAVVALYALALQGIVGAFARSGLPAPEAAHVLCAPDTAHAAHENGSAPAGPQPCALCCLALCRSLALPLPALSSPSASLLRPASSTAMLGTAPDRVRLAAGTRRPFGARDPPEPA